MDKIDEEISFLEERIKELSNESMKIRVKVRKRSIVRNQKAVVLWKRVELCESVQNQLQCLHQRGQHHWFQPKAAGSAHLPFRSSVSERRTSRRAHRRRISLVMDKREF